jgi:hypothetical protein
MSERKTVNGRGLTRFGIAMWAFILITLGTLETSFVSRGILNARRADMQQLSVAVVTDAISWMALPLIAWLTFDGFHRTTHLARTIGITFAAAIICEVPYDMATFQKWWDLSSQNIIWAIGAALILLWVFRMVDPQPPDDWYQGPHMQMSAAGAWAIRIIVVIAALLWMGLFNVGMRLGLVNEGVIIITMTVIFELLYRRENTMMYTAAIVGVLMFLTPGMGVMILHFRNGKSGFNHSWTILGFAVAYLVELLLFGAMSMAL